MDAMSPDMVHRFWILVLELGRSSLGAQASDADLLMTLVNACQQKYPLSNLEPSTLSSYISSRLPLIRDMVLG